MVSRGLVPLYWMGWGVWFAVEYLFSYLSFFPLPIPRSESMFYVEWDEYGYL